MAVNSDGTLGPARCILKMATSRDFLVRLLAAACGLASAYPH